MKVCFITPYPLRIVSGVSTVVTELCKGLKKRDLYHFVISGRLKDEVEKEKGIDAIEIDVSKFTHLRGTFLAIKTIINILKHRNNFELLHLQSPHLQPMVSAIIGKILGKPVITTIHGKFPRPENIFKRIYFWVKIKGTFTFSDIITFVDEEAKKHYGVTSGLVIENGIDSEFFSPDPTLRRETKSKLGLSENDVVLLYLGRLTANKGIYDLLEAFSAIKNKVSRRLKLILVGSGEKDNIFERIKSLRLEDDVLLFENTKEIKAYYCVADIFVLYSEFEGLPMVLLEASSCGLAIVSTRIGGIPHLINDGENGLLLEYGDINALAKYIEMVSEDEKLRGYLGLNARKRIIENYDIDKVINNYVNIYEMALQNKRL
jgi:glycosyltransferase involved in cell wall biosynthesis